MQTGGQIQMSNLEPIYLLTHLQCPSQNLMPSRHSINVWSKNNVWMNELMQDKEGRVSNYSKISDMTVSSVQSLSRVRLFVTPWTAALQASLSITSSWSLLKLISIKSVMPSNHLILCHFLLLPLSIFPSIRFFSNESSHQVAKVLEFQLQHQSFQWIFRTDFLKMDWFDLLAVQRSFKSLL